MKMLTKPCAPFKVKYHTCIVGNEHVSVIATFQATQFNASNVDTGTPCAGIGGNPFYELIWFFFEGNNPLTQHHQKLQIYLHQNPSTLQISKML